MRNKFGNLFMILGAVFLCGALVLFLYNRQEARTAEQASVELLTMLVEELKEREEEQLVSSVNITVCGNEASRENVADLAPGIYPDELEIPDSLLTAEDPKMPEVVLDDQAYIGVLSLPALQLELPIMSEWSYAKLRIAPCRYYGSLQGDNLVLMAHNYTRHFGNISRLSEGEQVLFCDTEGNFTEYEVVAHDILDPYAVEEITAGDFDLTLFTCTYGGQSRVVVYCDRVD